MAHAQKLQCVIAGAYLLAVSALGIASYDHFRVRHQAAVVDLDEIASKLGSDVRMEAAVSHRAEKLNRQLVIVRQQLEGQIAEAEKDAAESSESNKAKAVQAIRSKAERLMAEANRKAAANLQSYRRQLIAEFRQQSKAVASKVARERNISLVVAKNEALVLDYESAIDITDHVVERSLVRLASAVEPVTGSNESTLTK